MPVLTRRRLLEKAAVSAYSAAVTTARTTGAAAAAATAVGATVAACDDSPGQPIPEPTLGLSFPTGFVWGAATSAYQIEGAAAEDGRTPSVWDTFSHTPGKVRNGDTGDVAADHYHRFAADLDLMKSIGLSSYRFSIAWPRVIRDGKGPVNQQGLDFYKRLVDGLHQRGITPMATLYHWDTPQALQDAGGWENRDTAYRFAEYAAAVTEALGDSVPTWLTLNEPKTVVQNGYLNGGHAPGFRDPAKAYVVAHHLMLAHGLAVEAARPHIGGSRIGPALNLHPCYPADESADAAEQTHLMDGFENRLYLDPVFRGEYPRDTLEAIAAFSPMAQYIKDGDLKIISAPVDVLAVQYYTPIYVTAGGGTVQKHPLTEAFWQQIYPRGLTDILVRVKKDYGDVPLTITENGLPTPDQLGADGKVDDAGRIAFLRDHFAAAHAAIAQGVRLESYHVWSFMDNFEWQEGYEQRWGLIYVDYPTQRRIPKRSALWYSDVIHANKV
ncbi:MAG: beta-glucosidase [Hamadaea sp.]|uniref:GH1 family beta-glucosidase n=1 Tax=Hamadaea sp. TaxID=2024425 RepID=UPI001838EE06|nr:GH1 family beta-glucosidase [Hamadaea sp.]NUR73479.1 beta-glucosidase [Hamadaea sp.]NUT19167.1 beta-glucosidase [Hamadaea sp.]